MPQHEDPSAEYDRIQEAINRAARNQWATGYYSFDGSRSSESIVYHTGSPSSAEKPFHVIIDETQLWRASDEEPVIKVPPAERVDVDEPIRLTMHTYATVPIHDEFWDDTAPPVEPELPVGGGLGISWKTALERIKARDPFMGEIAELHEPVDFVVAGKVYKPDCSCDDGMLWHYCETAMILLRSVGLDVNDIDFQVGDAAHGEDGGSV